MKRGAWWATVPGIKRSFGHDWVTEHIHKYTHTYTSANSFTSCFPNLNSFFSYLTFVARTSKTMSRKAGKNGYLCLIPDLRGNVFDHWVWYYLQVSSYTALIICRHVSSMPSFWIVFPRNGCWALSKAFLHLLRWS